MLGVVAIQDWKMRRAVISSKSLASSLTLLAFWVVQFWGNSVDGFSIEEYCGFFSSSDVRPIICVLKSISSTSSTPRTWSSWSNNSTNNHTDTDWDWEEDCTCEIHCRPRFNRTDEEISFSSSEEWFYNCGSCGSSCPINQSAEEFTRPRCSCALVGGSALKSKCSCSATCATFRGLFKHKFQHFHGGHGPPPMYIHPPPDHDYEESESDDDEDDDDVGSNCIFNVNNVFDGFIIDESSRSLNCDCGRSKRAESTQQPDFVCVCQQV